MFARNHSLSPATTQTINREVWFVTLSGEYDSGNFLMIRTSPDTVPRKSPSERIVA